MRQESVRRGQGSGVRSQGSGVSTQESVHRGQGSGVRSQESVHRRQELECRVGVGERWKRFLLGVSTQESGATENFVVSWCGKAASALLQGRGACYIACPKITDY